MNYSIDQIKRLEAFEDIDRHVASYLSSVKGDNPPLFFLIVMLLCRCIDRGDVCLLLEKVAGRDISWLAHDDPENAALYSDIALPGIDEIAACIMGSGVAGTGNDRLPLILSGNRLYFFRYMVYENELAALINSMCSDTDDLPPDDELAQLFGKYFPYSGDEPDMQACAAAVSLRRRLSVISGGPGTGKTSTVVRILSLITDARRMSGLETSVALAAPTGKAAARLAASAADAGFSTGQGASFTLHRLLGYGWNSGFRHGGHNPVDYDVVVADECSMADLPLMHRFVSSLKKGSRLILLGDRDQLASVEGGAVFGDICGRGVTSYSSGLAEWVSRITGSMAAVPAGGKQGIGDSITFLTKSWRFGKESGIGALAAAVRRGDSDEALRILCSGFYEDLGWVPDSDRSSLEPVISGAAERYMARGNTGYDAVKAIISRFCILTALRKGPAGMEAMNMLAESALSSMDIIDPSVTYYDGRPVMVTGNDYGLSLFNGDIGIVYGKGEGGGALFQSGDGGERKVLCGRLPVHETAYAMTIHKSQGSEFDEVLVVLPRQWNRIMTRELLYTAITRGRKKVVIAGSAAVIGQMVQTGLERMSGLRDRLHST